MKKGGYMTLANKGEKQGEKNSGNSNKHTSD